ncbi:excisionase [Silvimonas soli]|uniref:excisionase n=1 Tax=Silvimonas soli TaxID=2980100 RepID=UPI0024B33762|nr:excisionase [Silvimonas soli]
MEAVITRPVRYVQIDQFCAMTGYTDRAVRSKIHEGVWIEGVHYRRAPDRHVLIDLEGYEKWVEGQRYASQALSRAKAA